MLHFALALGRTALVAIFIWSGFGKLMSVERTAVAIAAEGLAQPQILAVLAGLVEVVLGVMVVLGFKTRWAAVGLMLFTAAATYVFHDFWTMTGQTQQSNMIQAFKNLSIIGGLSAIAIVGAGRFSIDRG